MRRNKELTFVTVLQHCSWPVLHLLPPPPWGTRLAALTEATVDAMRRAEKTEERYATIFVNMRAKERVRLSVEERVKRETRL